jgi:NAD(P)-dependent dehydrogenase (short-subunit alcohol dehydrogenase family)
MKDIAQAFRLEGKVALVTGGAKGLGAAIARTLAQAGARVLVTDVLEAEGRRVVAGIEAGGGTAGFLRHDVTDEAQWQAAVAMAIERYGRLDVLVNNAGIEVPALLADCTVESFRRTLDVNVTGVFLGLKHAIRAMAPGGASGHGGAIVNLSSVAGLIGAVAHSAYCASKGAVRLLTKAAAVECGRLATGIRVNSLHPGVIETDMGSNFIQGFVDLGLAPSREASAAAVLALHPLGRFGEPEDVANAVLYLASDASKWVTGAELSVDGGIAAS